MVVQIQVGSEVESSAEDGLGVLERSGQDERKVVDQLVVRQRCLSSVGGFAVAMRGHVGLPVDVRPDLGFGERHRFVN